MARFACFVLLTLVSPAVAVSEVLVGGDQIFHLNPEYDHSIAVAEVQAIDHDIALPSSCRAQVVFRVLENVHNSGTERLVGFGPEQVVARKKMLFPPAHLSLRRGDRVLVHVAQLKSPRPHSEVDKLPLIQVLFQMDLPPTYKTQELFSYLLKEPDLGEFIRLREAGRLDQLVLQRERRYPTRPISLGFALDLARKALQQTPSP